MSYLIDLAKKNGVLPHRQKIPDSAFIEVKRIKALYGEGNEDMVLPIIAISFCWMTKPHPDPNGDVLKVVAAALEAEQPKYAKKYRGDDYSFQGFKEMGVFWDWASLYQKDPALFDPNETPDVKLEGPEREAFNAELKAKRSFFGGAAYEKSRSGEEKAAFDYALHETMDLWYAHQGTVVYKVTTRPQSELPVDRPGYGESGWPFYESCSADQVKKFKLFYAPFKLVLDLCDGRVVDTQRSWPVDPDSFNQELEEKQFTNGADQSTVMTLYRKKSEGQLGDITHLNYEGMESPLDLKQAGRLGRCLNLCNQLKWLDLNAVKLTWSSFEALFNALTPGSLPELERLEFYKCGVFMEYTDGLAALANALIRGCRMKLERIGLDDWHGNNYHSGLESICKTRGIRI